MKKTNILSLLLVFSMLLALVGCQKPEAPVASSSAPVDSSSSEPTDPTPDEEEDLSGEESEEEVAAPTNPLALMGCTYLSVDIGTEASIDLDGDGTDETIFYGIEPYMVGENGEYTENKPAALTVNGVDFLSDDENNPMEGYGFWIENPDTQHYFILDMNTEDGLLELAVTDWGSNDWLTTHLFHYENGELSYLGYLPSFPDDENTTYFGDGSVSVLDHLSIMQTWMGFRTYVLMDGKIQPLPTQMIATSPSWTQAVYLRQELEVYVSPNEDSEKITLSPSDDPVQLPLTDDKHWVNIIMSDGTEGWIYFEELYHMQNGDAIVNADTVFDGLIYAG